MWNHRDGSQIVAIIFVLLRSGMESRLKSTSFGCPCGQDPNNKNQNVYKIGRQDSRIIGGEEVKHPNPWFVFIKFQYESSASQFRCGGTLLNQRWAVTAAHCFCNTKKKFKCKMRKGRLQPTYDVKKYAQLYIGINVASVGRVGSERFRGIGKVIIHEDYKIGGLDTHDDVALVKFDRPLLKSKWALNSTSNNLINPICLPDISYNEQGKLSFVTGFGLEYQKTCRTNGKGPDIYTECASGSISSDNKIDHHWTEDKYGNKNWRPGCTAGFSPSRLDKPCEAFNAIKQLQLEKAYEFVLVPKDKSKKPYSCFHADVRKQKKHEKKIEKSEGWCGTCVQGAKNNTPGYCGPGSGNGDKANYAKVTSNSGWAFCTPECRVRTAQWSEYKLQIVDQSILSEQECKKLLKGIKSNKTLNASKQLCAGNKIKNQKQLFYEYDGKGKDWHFKEIKPIRNYRSPQKKFVPGLNFMIGGKDSCLGDSGGPLWTREQVKGKELAYLVGVVSAGAAVTDCANLNSPAFYTRIKHFLKWIKKHTSDGQCSQPRRRSKSSKQKNKKNKRSLSKTSNSKKRRSKPVKKKKKSSPRKGKKSRKSKSKKRKSG